MISRRNFFKRSVALACAPVIGASTNHDPVASAEMVPQAMSVNTSTTYLIDCGFVAKGYKSATIIEVVPSPWAVS